MIDFTKVGRSPAVKNATPENPPGSKMPPVEPSPIRASMASENGSKPEPFFIGRVDFSPEVPDVMAPPPAKPDPLDLKAAQALIAGYDVEIEEMIAEAKAFVVDSQETTIEATERAGKVQTFVNQFDARRKEVIADADSFVRRVNAAVKPRRDKLDAVVRQYKSKIGDFSYRETLRLREMERKQNEERAKLQAALDAEAREKNVAPVQVAPVAMPTKQGPTRSESASSSVQTKTVPVVANIAEVPVEYLHKVFRVHATPGETDQTDTLTRQIWSRLESAIMEAHAAGLRNVAGVEFREVPVVTLRRVG